MNKADFYLEHQIWNILDNGYLDKNPRPKYTDGTPAYTLSVNGNFREYDIGNGDFPITTLRPIAWKSAIKEIFWIYQDQSNDLNLLNDKYKVSYWNQWESKDINGTIGIRYGAIVKEHNLMNKLLNELTNDPYGRRHIIDLYQYADMDKSDGLYPCAFLTIWNVRQDMNTHEEYLDLTLIQRSGDLLAASCSGVNEIQYSALLMMVARHCGYKTGKLFHYVANEQIYDRHKEQAKELRRRFDDPKRTTEEEYDDDENYYLGLYKPNSSHYVSYNDRRSNPKLILNPNKNNFYDFTIDDFTMINYNPIKPQLKFELGI